MNVFIIDIFTIKKWSLNASLFGSCLEQHASILGFHMDNTNILYNPFFKQINLIQVRHRLHKAVKLYIAGGNAEGIGINIRIFN